MAMCINMDTPQTAVMAMCLAIFGSDMVLSPSWTTCLDVGGRNAGTVSGAMKELEETAKLYLMLRNLPIKVLTDDQCEALQGR